MTNPDLKKVRTASRILAKLSDVEINNILTDIADNIPRNIERILNANKEDLSRMPPEDPRYDRLMLDEKRLQNIANDIRNVVSLPSPLNKVLEERTLKNGLELSRISVVRIEPPAMHGSAAARRALQPRNPLHAIHCNLATILIRYDLLSTGSTRVAKGMPFA